MKFESLVEIGTDNSDHQKNGKDIREEIRKLKKAYKILKSEKDKETKELQAENKFVWNQLKTMEGEYSRTIKSKNIEVKQATEAAQKLLQNVNELQVAAQKKDDEIVRLEEEVTNAKERMSILEDELQKLRSLVKGKDLETDKDEDGQPETSRMSKKDTNKANRKSKSTRTSQVTPDISRTSQVTPDRREVKTTTRMHVSETNQKRKRSSFKSSLSCVSILFTGI
jgi:chromosome segregation ATPase